jgi:hypothetical protein
MNQFMPTVTVGFADYLTSITHSYAKNNNCPYHEALDVDIEDIAEYFIIVLDEQQREKQKKLLESFENI